MQKILWIDPGISTGVALGEFSESKPYVRIKVWQLHNGVNGFVGWWQSKEITKFMSTWNSTDILGSENFVLRRQSFVANLEPVKIEGAMVALGIDPIYQSRTKKALVKDQVLKEHGLWLTGKQVGHTDARDCLDATIHSLAYLKSIGHIPTLRHYWP